MQRNQLKKVTPGISLNLNKVNALSELTREYIAEVLLLPVASLQPYELQSRKIFNEEALEGLANSIKEVGIRNPLTVIKSNKGDYYEIISGERRYKAALKLGIDKLPCMVVENDRKAQEIALIENIQRENLHPVELFNGINDYVVKNPTISYEQLYTKLGISKATFYRLLSLSRLTEEAKEMVLKHNIVGNFLYFVSKAVGPKQVGMISEKLGLGEPTVNEVVELSVKPQFKINYSGKNLSIKHNFEELNAETKEELLQLLKNTLLQLELIKKGA